MVARLLVTDRRLPRSAVKNHLVAATAPVSLTVFLELNNVVGRLNFLL
jgi:hypothetical protein